MDGNNILIKVGADITDFSRKMRQSTSELEKFTKANAETFDSFKKVGAGITAGGAAIAVGLGASVKEAIKFQSAFTGVRKTVDMSEEEFAVLSRGIRDMAKEIPAAATEIAAVAEAAGQLGVQNDAILSFTRTMVDMGVATDMASDDAAMALARLATITQMNQKDFDRLGSTIVGLGNNLAATESEIVEMGLRLAGAGKVIGMTEAQILGFSGALAAVGVNAEAGGSAFSKLFIEAANLAATGGKGLTAFAKVAGMSASDFQKAFKEDATDAIISFIEGLGKINEAGGNVFGVLDDLGLSEIRLRDALLRTSGASDVLRESVELGTRSWDENNALTKEAGERYKTAESQLQLLKNTVVDAAISFGDALLPTLIKVTDGLRKLVDRFNKLSPATKQTIAVITAVTSAFLLLVGPLLMLVGFIPSIIKGWKTVATVFKAVGKTFGSFGKTVARFIKPTTLLRGGVRLLGRAIGLLTGPIGWVILAVIELALIFRKLYQTNEEFRDKVVGAWKTVQTKVSEAITAFTNVFGPAFKRIKEAVQELVKVFRDNFSDDFQRLSKAAGKAWENFGVVVVKAFEHVEKVAVRVVKIFVSIWRVIAEVVRIGTDLFVGLINSVTKLLDGDFAGAWRTAVETVKNAQGEVDKYIGKLVEWAANKFSELKSKISEKLTEIGADFAAKLREWQTSIVEWFKAMPMVIATQLAEWTVALIKWAEAQDEENKRQFTAWGVSILAWFTETRQEMIDKLAEWGISILAWYTETRQGIIDKLADWGESIRTWFTEMPGNIWSALETWWKLMGMWFSEIPKRIEAQLDLWWRAFQVWFKAVPEKPEVKNVGKNIIDKVAEGTKEKQPEFMDKLGAIIVDVMKGAFQLALIAIIATGREIIKRIIEGVTEKKADLQTKAKEMIDSFKAKVAEVDLWQVGRDIVSGLITGLGSKVSDLLTKASEIAESVKKRIAGAFIVKSPSRWMRDHIGKNMILGWIRGLDGMKTSALRAASQLTDWMTPEVPQVSIGYDTPNGSYGTLAGALDGTVDVNASNDMLAGAIASLEQKLTNLTVEMDKREVGRIVAPTVSEEINGQRTQTTRGRGQRRI